MEYNAKTSKEHLKRIKQNIDDSYRYFEKNYKRFHEFRKFVFKTSLTEADVTVLTNVGKPNIEFNVQEAYISRLRGEFSKQEPSIIVHAADGKPIDVKTIELTSGHMRSILMDSNKDAMEWLIYTDILSGGFSALKVWTEYASTMSFSQVIRMRKCFSPTLVGFDPLARTPHKGDGNYAYECFPKRIEDLEEEGYDVSDIKTQEYSNSFNGFKWSYLNERCKTVMLCDYYEKKKRNKKIYQLANGKTIQADQYKKFLEEWHKNSHIEQPASIVGERYAEIQTICRYRLVENKILDYKETDYNLLPLIFVDGNSIILDENGACEQMTRPYCYHGMGAQKLLNFAGQTWANELENMVMHKWKVPKEGIPSKYSAAYTNNQIPNVVIYNAYKDNDPDKPLPPPEEVQRVPMPPEVAGAFNAMLQIMQNIYGAYDASLGIQDKDLSGLAIQEGATQSNAAAMPFVVGFLQALNQAAQVIVDLIPKYLITPRTIPVIGIDGKRQYVKINQNGQKDIKYDAGDLDVTVEAGVNFSVQKARALQTVISLQQACPEFGQFMMQKGLMQILDNLEIRGIEELKVLGEQYMQEIAKQKAMAQNQPNPIQAKIQLETQKAQSEQQDNQQKNQLKAQELSVKEQVEMAHVAVDQQNADTDRLTALSNISEAQQTAQIQAERLQTENTGQAVKLAMEAVHTAHTHVMDITNQAHDQLHDKAQLAHEVIKTINEPKQEKKDE